MKDFKQKNDKIKRSFVAFGRLAYPVVCLCIAFIVFFAASFAWFSMNKEVKGSGIELSVETTSNLVISTTNDGSEGSISDTSADTVTLELSAKLHPATHDSNYSTYSTGLKYVKNLEDVSRTSGYTVSGETYTFAEAANSTDSKYYCDYTIYVASLNKALENCTALNVEITDISDIANERTTDGENNPTYVFNAASIDFYIITDVEEGATINPTSSNYVGTLNVAGEKADGDAGEYKLDLFQNITTKTVPLNTDKSICIVMRCYFDGALEDGSTGNAYVTSNLIETLASDANVTMGFKITAEAPAQE